MVSNDSPTVSLERLLTEPDLPHLATIGEATYHTLHLIVRRTAGTATAYCLERDWAASTAGQIVGYQQRIAELEAELDRVRGTPKAPNPAREIPPLAPCPYPGCSVQKPAGRSLAMHQRRVHGGPYRAEVPTPDPPLAGAMNGHAQPAMSGHRVAAREGS